MSPLPEPDAPHWLHSTGAPVAASRSRPPGSARDVSARAILAALLPRPFDAALSALAPHELDILRCHELDALLLEQVATSAVPRDLLRTPPARARIVALFVPEGGLIAMGTAVWVHLGGRPPREIDVIHPARRGRTGTMVYSRMTVASSEVEIIGGAPCCTLARAVADVARIAAPVTAVETMLRARDAGVPRSRLEAALLTDRGALRSRGERARRIIDAVMPQCRDQRHDYRHDPVEAGTVCSQP